MTDRSTGRSPRSSPATARTPSRPDSRATGRAAAGPPSSRSRTATPRKAAGRATRGRGASGQALGQPLVRLRSGLLIVLVLLSMIGMRLVWLQGFEGGAYAERAVEQRLKKVELQAPRGTITDRTGQALAMSVDARAVYAEPRNIAKAVCPSTATKPCTTATIAAALAPDLGLPIADLQDKLARPAGQGKTCSPADVLGCTAFVYLARGLDAAAGNRIRDLGLVGVGVLAEPKRVHPGTDLAANVLGFTTVEGQGNAGIEKQWEDVLAGRSGERIAEVDGGGRVMPSGMSTVVEPKPGRDLQLTIDRDVQWYAQKALMERLAATDAESGSAVVMDVTTGQVLALASVPTFNADEPGKADAAIRGNQAVTDVFEPGSIGKAITVAAVLEAGALTPDSVLSVPDHLRLSTKVFRDSHSHPTEQMTLTGVLVESSNVGTIMAAQKIGGPRLYEMLSRFGIGAKTGIGLPGESRGILRGEAQWSGTDYGTHPIGQGYAVNGVQMASVYATIANDGVRVTPTMVKSVAGPGGALAPAAAPAAQRIISSQVAAQLRGMLEGVTNEGGTAADTAAIDGYRVAGKTGTAQRAGNGGYNNGYTASFVGFAPADQPRLVVSVSIQNPKKGYYGGAVAGPVFRDVMSFALRSQGVPPTGAPSPKLRLRAGD